jgi:predicted nuclease of predicted toxin-antitoxin system
MRFLIDMNLGTDWVDLLQSAGHDAIHWSRIGAPNEADDTIMARAIDEQRIVLTADLDFGASLAAGDRNAPSVVQLRTEVTLPGRIGRHVLRAIDHAKDDLKKGALVVVERQRFRVRSLPMNKQQLGLD